MKMTSDVPLDQIDDNLAPKKDLKKPKLPHSMILNQQTISQYWKILRENTDLTLTEQKIIADPATLDHIEAYGNNIENCIGTIKVPVGIAGPIRVNGLFAQGDYYLPLATTEAALVASYSRGARLISEAGGCSAAVINDGITRSPGFAFQNLADALKFVLWTNSQFDTFKKKSEATTKHGKLVDVRTTVEGNHVYLNFDFFTGDASGQNMVTIATAAILDYIRQNSPVKPKHIFIEANLSGDKKASALSFLSVRGKKLTAPIRSFMKILPL
jgi:hydroxymethylglutaryl-CoA reductase (NADPH)